VFQQQLRRQRKLLRSDGEKQADLVVASMLPIMQRIFSNPYAVPHMLQSDSSAAEKQTTGYHYAGATHGTANGTCKR
jgi:hypothetical protein